MTQVYDAEVGQLKVNNNKVMCPLAMTLFDMFGQTPSQSHTLDKIVAKHIPVKTKHISAFETK